MKIYKIFLIISIFLLSFSNAHAYIGPGMGVGAIIGVVSILSLIILTIFAIIYYPLKIWLKKIIKNKKNNKNNTEN